MDFIKDILAALSVILNGLPQGLLALSFGFASIPTALAFFTGAVGNAVLGNVAPISFQAETITLAGTMGKNIRERLSMVIIAGGIMTVIGLLGLLERIVAFIGPVITNGMMAGVGIMLTKVAIDMTRKNKYVGLASLASAILTYFITRDLVYTIAVSVIFSSIISIMLRQTTDSDQAVRESITFQKPIFTFPVLRGALAIAVLTVGANIAFGKITGGIAAQNVNVDHLSIVSGLADMVSAFFGGGPVESIISATGSAPNPLLSGIIMMALMGIILITGLLPKIGKYIPSESIAGFLFVLGAFVTVPINAGAAFAATDLAGGPVIAGVTITVTAITDPFLGMVAGIITKALIGAFGI